MRLQCTLTLPFNAVLTTSLLCGAAAGLQLHLDNLKIYHPDALANGEGFSGNVLVAPGATVGKGCLIGPDVSIGDGCVIGDGVRLSNCVVMRGVRIKDHSKVGVLTHRRGRRQWGAVLAKWQQACRVHLARLVTDAVGSS
jgi:acetyltransferase-like isoleucine patch superfamily enzyme